MTRRLAAALGRTHMERTRNELLVFLVGGALLAVGALFAVAWAAGFEHVANDMRRVQPWYLVAAIGGEALAYVGYMLAYREVARVERGPGLPARRIAALVSAGFGVFVVRGGFAVDLHAFRETCVSDRDARVRVLGLGALEYALLAPAACAAAIFLLLQGSEHPSPGITLPWAIAVPVGFAAALWAVEHRRRFHGTRGWRAALGEALDSVYVLRRLFVDRGHIAGPLGASLYWFGDVFCLWACLQAFTHGTPSIAPLLVGYATGYALTRRTLPFAGAGAVEALLPFALHWCGVDLAAAVLAVLAYRIFNLWLPVVPAAAGLRTLRRG